MTDSVTRVGSSPSPPLPAEKTITGGKGPIYLTETEYSGDVFSPIPAHPFPYAHQISAQMMFLSLLLKLGDWESSGILLPLHISFQFNPSVPSEPSEDPPSLGIPLLRTLTAPFLGPQPQRHLLPEAFPGLRPLALAAPFPHFPSSRNVLQRATVFSDLIHWSCHCKRSQSAWNRKAAF